MGDLDLNVMFAIDRAGLLASRNLQGAGFNADNDAKSAAFGAANAARTTALEQNQTTTVQDYGGGIWMLTHMIMFRSEYRPNFGEFVGTLGTGVPTGTALTKVFGRSLSQVGVDLAWYAKQPSLSAANLPFKYEKPAAAQVRPATKEDVDRILADLARKSK